MVLTEITGGFDLSGDDVSFLAALFILFLFYLQYRKYEYELEKEEMIDGLIRSDENN